jgi:hypothetical protein
MAEPKWRRYLRFWKSDPRADAEEELSFHIESRIAEFRASGMSEDDAKAEAMRRFGDFEPTCGMRCARTCGMPDVHCGEIPDSHSWPC